MSDEETPPIKADCDREQQEEEDYSGISTLLGSHSASPSQTPSASPAVPSPAEGDDNWTCELSPSRASRGEELDFDLPCPSPPLPPPSPQHSSLRSSTSSSPLSPTADTPAAAAVIVDISVAWCCPVCTYENQPLVSCCEICNTVPPLSAGAPLQDSLPQASPFFAAQWLCPQCTYSNSPLSAACDICGTQKVEPDGLFPSPQPPSHPSDWTSYAPLYPLPTTPATTPATTTATITATTTATTTATITATAPAQPTPAAPFPSFNWSSWVPPSDHPLLDPAAPQPDSDPWLAQSNNGEDSAGGFTFGGEATVPPAPPLPAQHPAAPPTVGWTSQPFGFGGRRSTGSYYSGSYNSGSSTDSGSSNRGSFGGLFGAPPSTDGLSFDGGPVSVLQPPEPLAPPPEPTPEILAWLNQFWCCGQCTLENSNRWPVCEACQNERPPLPANLAGIDITPYERAVRDDDDYQDEPQQQPQRVSSGRYYGLGSSYQSAAAAPVARVATEDVVNEIRELVLAIAMEGVSGLVDERVDNTVVSLFYHHTRGHPNLPQSGIEDTLGSMVLRLSTPYDEQQHTENSRLEDIVVLSTLVPQGQNVYQLLANEQRDKDSCGYYALYNCFQAVSACIVARMSPTVQSFANLSATLVPSLRSPRVKAYLRLIDRQLQEDPKRAERLASVRRIMLTVCLTASSLHELDDHLDSLSELTHAEDGIPQPLLALDERILSLPRVSSASASGGPDNSSSSLTDDASPSLTGDDDNSEHQVTMTDFNDCTAWFAVERDAMARRVLRRIRNHTTFKRFSDTTMEILREHVYHHGGLWSPWTYSEVETGEMHRLYASFLLQSPEHACDSLGGKLTFMTLPELNSSALREGAMGVPQIQAVQTAFDKFRNARYATQGFLVGFADHWVTFVANKVDELVEMFYIDSCNDPVLGHDQNGLMAIAYGRVERRLSGENNFQQKELKRAHMMPIYVHALEEINRIVLLCYQGLTGGINFLGHCLRFNVDRVFETFAAFVEIGNPKLAEQEMGTRDIFDRPGDHTDVASRANKAHRRTPIPDWECSACTYHNVSGEAQCSICGTEAPAFGFEEQAETSQVDRLLGWASECFRPQTLRITFLPRVQALAGSHGLQKELRKRTQNFISIIKTCADTGILARRQQQVTHWKSFQLEDSLSETISSSSSYLSQAPPVVAPSSDAIEIKLSREIELLEDLDHLAESLSAVLNQGRSSLVHSTEGSLEPSIRDKTMRLSQ